MELHKKNILVVGLGRSGLSAARWLSESGAEVTVSEMKPERELDGGLLQEVLDLGANLETGGHREGTFIKADMIIVSPGVPLDIAPLRAAGKRGKMILGELELAARMIDIPIIAVTGTNGKSTTAELIGSMIKNAGLRVFLGGNIGTPLMDYVSGGREADYAVVEVSSFQLDTIERFNPLISLLLNISPDHLDRYPDYESYVQSKLKIFQNQGKGQYAILNDDDGELSRYKPSGGVSVLRYGRKSTKSRQVFLNGNKMIVSLPGIKVRHFSTHQFRLPGGHNLENLMGAVLAGLSLNIDPTVIQNSIDRFQGLPHRLFFVKRIKGVDFYDDSKATNVDAASRSITSFDRPLIVIAGGRHKGADYSPLLQASRGIVKRTIFLGEAKDLLAESFHGVIPFSFAEDMEDALLQAFSFALPNDVVLLAPACASFDMYSDYAHRGRTFQEAVEKLENDR